MARNKKNGQPLVSTMMPCREDQVEFLTQVFTRQAGRVLTEADAIALMREPGELDRFKQAVTEMLSEFKLLELRRAV